MKKGEDPSGRVDNDTVGASAGTGVVGRIVEEDLVEVVDPLTI